MGKPNTKSKREKQGSKRESRANGTDEFICKAAMGKQTWRTDMGRGEERVRCMERVM